MSGPMTASASVLSKLSLCQTPGQVFSHPLSLCSTKALGLTIPLVPCWTLSPVPPTQLGSLAYVIWQGPVKETAPSLGFVLNRQPLQVHSPPSHISNTVLSIVYVGGAEGIRTPDPLNAMIIAQVLSKGGLGPPGQRLYLSPTTQQAGPGRGGGVELSRKTRPVRTSG